jgi:succinate dehydrogenase / fumarate reductase, cytochrome b subunit
MSTTTLKDGQPGSKAIFKDSFLMHKLHSLTGVLPIGLFMIFHLTMNSYALRGEVEFNTVVKAIGYTPFVAIVEWVAIFIPILFHAGYGFVIAMEAQGPNGNLQHYKYGRNALYYLQRVSGIVAIVFLVGHMWTTWWVKKAYEIAGNHDLGFQSISYAAMTWRFENVGYFLFYVLGVGASAFHLGNGIFSFSIRWGLAIGKEAQKVAALLGAAVFFAMAGLGCWTALNFHLASKNYMGGGKSTREIAPDLDGFVKLAAGGQLPKKSTTEEAK